LVLLFFYVSTFRSMCAVPNMAVFCSSLTSWFPGISLTYFLNDLEILLLLLLLQLSFHSAVLIRSLLLVEFSFTLNYCVVRFGMICLYVVYKSTLPYNVWQATKISCTGSVTCERRRQKQENCTFILSVPCIILDYT